MGRAYANKKDSMAKTADTNAKVFSRYSREIYATAKSGGVEVEGNLALRSLIARAQKDQVPSHVIEKAMDKARGGGGEDFALARYEGYGPGNCTVIIDCLTDNVNRTFGDVRLCFTKTNCKIGAQGTVSHLFDHSAIFVFKGQEEEAVLDALMSADVDVSDIEYEAGEITVFAPNTEYFKAKQALLDSFGEIDFDVDEIQFIPQNMITISSEDIDMYNKFMEMLNNLEDVQCIYHNADI